MPPSTFSYFFHECFPDIPMWHWVIMIALSCALPVIVALRKRLSVYGLVSLGISCLMVMFLFDALVGIRLGAEVLPHAGFNITAELQRIIQGKRGVRYLMLFNAAGFAPLGFFLSAYLTAAKPFGAKQQLRIIFLTAMGLSFFIEILQLIFRLGWFEVTDIVMNLTGAMFGAGMSLLAHRLWKTA